MQTSFALAAHLRHYNEIQLHCPIDYEALADKMCGRREKQNFAALTESSLRRELQEALCAEQPQVGWLGRRCRSVH